MLIILGYANWQNSYIMVINHKPSPHKPQLYWPQEHRSHPCWHYMSLVSGPMDEVNYECLNFKRVVGVQSGVDVKEEGIKIGLGLPKARAGARELGGTHYWPIKWFNTSVVKIWPKKKKSPYKWNKNKKQFIHTHLLWSWSRMGCLPYEGPLQTVNSMGLDSIIHKCPDSLFRLSRSFESDGERVRKQVPDCLSVGGSCTLLPWNWFALRFVVAMNSQFANFNQMVTVLSKAQT